MITQIELIVSNIEDFENQGYHIEYNFQNNSLEITFNNKSYTVNLIILDNVAYWHLEPYNNSYFETKININHSNFDAILLAILENETLHNK